MTSHTLAEMLQDLRRMNSAWEVDQVVLLPQAATPWGLYRQILREIDARRGAIRDQAIAAEGHRRGALWAALTLRPLRARGLRLAAQEAERHAQELASILAHLEARARAVRLMLPERLDDRAVAQLEAEDGIARLARSVRAAAARGMLPAQEIEQAIAALPAPMRGRVQELAAPGADSWRESWLAQVHEAPGLAPIEPRRALEAAW
jgi:hypothetical protein